MPAVSIEQVERLAAQLSRADKLRLIERLSERLRLERSGGPKDLANQWRGRFPDDFDLDAALRQIRAA